MIYFIQQGIAGPIKIGKTEFVRNRMRGLQIGNPNKLRLVGVEDCDEIALHIKYREYRLRGEWFKASQKIVDYINQLDNLGRVTTPAVVYSDHQTDREREQEVEILELVDEKWELRNECNRLKTKKDTYREVELYITGLEKELNQAKDEIQCLKRKLRNWAINSDLSSNATPIFTNRKFQQQAIG